MSSIIKNYRAVQTLKKGGKSLKVVLMEDKYGNKIIKKKYDPNIETHRVSFHKEVRILKDLESYPYCPKLLHVVPEKFTFYETYCGGHVPKGDYYKEKMIQRTKDLYKKRGYKYVVDGEHLFFVHRKNYCLMGNTIFLIDFGSVKWFMPIHYADKNNNIVKIELGK